MHETVHFTFSRRSPGRGQGLFQKLLDLDEVCLEGTVVEEKRRVGPRSQILQLCWLPGVDRRVRRGGIRGGKRKLIRMDHNENNYYLACSNLLP